MLYKLQLMRLVTLQQPIPRRYVTKISLHLRHNLLDICPPRSSPSRLRFPNEPRQLKQVSDPEIRATGRHHDKRIIGLRTGPMRQQRTNLIRLINIEHPVFTPAMRIVDQVKFEPEQRMEWMGDPKRSALIRRFGCIRKLNALRMWNE